MSNKSRLSDYQLFFMEIPSQVDLDDIPIIDANEETPQQTGLSDDQVSQFTNDTLALQNNQPADNEPRDFNETQRQLFDN